ncbi:hypothetical protein GW952_30780 (plasmid) [Klebsiella michiganensis]|uniref:Uncharacterized protein n=1 Tax=Klebsiella michiganensis TaxID=1134687 RepID=A0A6P1V9K7_9ENTR|nr:hypothetical protein [Klebsiella michiganensis]QHS50006.1 hypothetical protein GW952_30780 [Klebsiella michiganensis]HDX8941050.1 hypothetical protein [Klebsiella michiganensis]
MSNTHAWLATLSLTTLLFSGTCAAVFIPPEMPEAPPLQRSSPPVTPALRLLSESTVLLHQILAELARGNAQRADPRCSDGDRQYSPGYHLSTGSRTLRCALRDGHPEWVSAGAPLKNESR